MKPKDVEDLLQRLSVKEPGRQLDHRVAKALGVHDPKPLDTPLPGRRSLFDIIWRPVLEMPQPSLVILGTLGLVLSLFLLWNQGITAYRIEVLRLAADARTATRDLPDGSQLVVSPNTEVAWQMNREMRTVVLHRGEIELKVVRDKRPLSVYTPCGEIAVVGTHFRVKVYSSPS